MISLARFSIIASLAILGWSSILAQQRLPNCASLPYEHHNQIDCGPLRVTSVRVTVKAADGYPVFQACVGIFTESGEKLLASAAANERGDFLVAGLPKRNIPHGQNGRRLLRGKCCGYSEKQATRKENMDRRHEAFSGGCLQLPRT